MITIKTECEIEIMAEAGKRLAEVRDTLEAMVVPGITTQELETRAQKLISEHDSTPAFLGYTPSSESKPYPAALCTSVNEVIVHGIPSAYILKEGDVLTIDLGLIYKKFYADTAVTAGVGTISPRAKKLIEATHTAFDAAFQNARLGKTLGDIGYAIEKTVKERRFEVAETLTGHGIGRALHEDPTVYNRGKPGQGEVIKAGMVLAIEPMIIEGGSSVRQRPDGSFVSSDGTLTAHYEHTVAITHDGPRILTKS